jgi:hypothetical protein
MTVPRSTNLAERARIRVDALRPSAIHGRSGRRSDLNQIVGRRRSRPRCGIPVLPVMYERLRAFREAQLLPETANSRFTVASVGPVDVALFKGVLGGRYSRFPSGACSSLISPGHPPAPILTAQSPQFVDSCTWRSFVSSSAGSLQQPFDRVLRRHKAPRTQNVRLVV